MNTVTTRQTTRAPRKTVAEKRAEKRAEKLAEEQAEHAARDKRDEDFKVGFSNAYSSRLLKLLHDVLSENVYGVTSSTQTDRRSGLSFECFSVQLDADLKYTKTEFPVNLVQVDRSVSEFRQLDYDMAEVEFDLRRMKRLMKEARAEQMVKAEKKKALLSKLTDEERELLGL